ncbi:MAG: hypothetical protein ACKVJX_07565 [Verrucomicrobiia bacterium]|jgi:hypothetical protein
MKPTFFSLSVLCSFLLCGCSSVQHYEVRLKMPNPYSAQVIRSSKKPQSKSESFVRFTDEHNQQFQIESKYVAAIKPPPPNPDGDKTTGNAKYQIILTEDNKYQVKVAYTPEMPERVTQRYYLIKRMDGRDLTIPHVYVLKIDPMTKKDLYDEPDPQFIDSFDYR